MRVRFVTGQFAVIRRVKFLGSLVMMVRKVVVMRVSSRSCFVSGQFAEARVAALAEGGGVVAPRVAQAAGPDGGRRAQVVETAPHVVVQVGDHLCKRNNNVNSMKISKGQSLFKG